MTNNTVSCEVPQYAVAFNSGKKCGEEGMERRAPHLPSHAALGWLRSGADFLVVLFLACVAGAISSHVRGQLEEMAAESPILARFAGYPACIPH